jgi:arsenate reductase
MSDKTYNVLFLCTGNSARSILAEVQLNALGGGRFRGYSAGSHPTGEVNPMTLQLLQQMGLSTDGLRSKSWDEFAAPGAPVMDFVFTVCDRAAGEQCPVWPGQPITAHWGVPDPVIVEGSKDAKFRALKDAAVTLRKRIELFKSLPLASLDRLALKKEVTDIGKSLL